MPTSVIEPVAVTVTWLSSALARPEMDASELVSGVPSYTFCAEPVVTVTEAGVTVRVPRSSETS